MTKFNSDVDGFLNELRLDAAAGEVDRLILRLTKRYERVTPAPFASLTVVASYTTGGEPVVLEARCGTFLPEMREEQDVQNRAAELYATIEAAAAELKLQLRAGVCEEAPLARAV